ncbi:uncharacterized protein LOC131300464 isoform X3 [Rhododendron vialii]|uniref:uncharacterized protein LOC131300464 isoform X3 n=1 Tax=Rhododendron vialii TaxID=182163 RepID=UPI00265F6366|nr:uncharacterized protein LOC131300464 isoform X3 [Rhododendron vialii]
MYRSGYGLRLTFFQTFNSIILPKSQSNSSSSTSRVFSSSFSTKRVGTHNGSFHCDEALACFLIRLTNKFSAARIVRSRDPQVLDTLDAVLDVGGVYDPIRDRFDHHQKGFVEVFGHGFSTKLSSAGLVYKHYGLEIIAKELHLEEGHRDVYRLYLAVYKNFVEAVDAIDNGLNQYDTHRPRYVDNTNLTSRIGRLNLDWVDPDQSEDRENEAFQHAMTLAGSEFLETVRLHAISWLPARSIVKECLAARQEIDSSGEIMVLTRSCPVPTHQILLGEFLESWKIYFNGCLLLLLTNLFSLLNNVRELT